MQYGLSQKPALTQNACLVFGVFPEEKQCATLALLDKETQDCVKKLSEKLQECGDALWQSDIQGHSLLVIHCGKASDFTSKVLQKNLKDVIPLLLKQRVPSASICMPPVPHLTPSSQLEKMLLQVDNLVYQLLDFKKAKPKPHALKNIDFIVQGADSEALEAAQAIAEGVRLTRNLANMPANICTPSYLAEEAEKLSKQFKTLQCKVLDKKDMQKLGMHTLLAVAQGSAEPPKFIELQYQGCDKNSQPLVLIGKGVTFDAGGISLKPPLFMEEMKFDMAGAASVLGVLKACALLQLPLNVVGLIPSVENLPSGTAVKPGDIVTSMSGLTVEIINTDAEGRLILADALTYAERFKPKWVIDIATLTGAIIIALGYLNTGLMTENEELAEAILQAAKDSEDKAWRMPLEEAYQEGLETPLADMANVPADRSAGSVIAACFLSRFAKKFPWAHLDIAGTAWVSGKNRCATGRPVPLLIQLLRNFANAR
jgi:leucyl aminopeptidase